MKRNLTILIASCLLVLGSSLMTANAAEKQAYGWQLMTPQERTEYRNKMRSMKTAEERKKYRMEHHKMMQERAKERGVTLPDMPGPHGKGMGPGKSGGPGKCGGG